jgi:hypothetical protein
MEDCLPIDMSGVVFNGEDYPVLHMCEDEEAIELAVLSSRGMTDPAVSTIPPVLELRPLSSSPHPAASQQYTSEYDDMEELYPMGEVTLRARANSPDMVELTELARDNIRRLNSFAGSAYDSDVEIGMCARLQTYSC